MELTSETAATELGPLPADWKVDELGSLNPFVTSGSRGWARYYSERGATFVRITNLTRASIYLDLSDLKFVNLPASDSEGLRTQLMAGDLLVSITADIGIIGYVDHRLPAPAYINQHIALVRCNPDTADPRFLAYYLASAVPQRAFRGGTDQGAKAGMNLAGVRKIRAAFPPLSEQQAIARALGDVDALLERLDQLIAKKRNLRIAVMQQLLSGQTRLPGFNDAWKERVLGEHVRFLKNGVNPRADLRSEGRVRYLHYGDIHTSVSPLLDVSIANMPRLPDALADRIDRLENGDLVFVDASEDLSGVGKSVEISGASGLELVAGLHTIAARFDKDVLADGFKGYLQFCRPFRDQLARLAQGTKVFATTRLHIASVVMSLPGVDEQRAIARVLSECEREILALEAVRKKTSDVKLAMSQELLTGKTRLHTTGGSNG